MSATLLSVLVCSLFDVFFRIPSPFITPVTVAFRLSLSPSFHVLLILCSSKKSVTPMQTQIFIYAYSFNKRILFF